MRTVTVRVRASDLAHQMAAMREWLDRHRYEPARFVCDQQGDAVDVSVEFPDDHANFGVSDRRFRFKPAGGFGGNRQAVSVQSGTPLRMGFGPGFGEPPLRDTYYLAVVCQSKYSYHYL